MTLDPRRIPIQDPHFRYPASPNPYYKKVREADLKGRVFSDEDTEAHRGRWLELFPDAPNATTSSGGQTRPLHVEIGCNGGHVVLGWAERNPEAAYMGLDWKFKQIYLAGQKSLKRKLHNILFLRAHAERMEYIFGPGEIDFLYLYFPDPWPKKAHWKNRYVTEANLRKLGLLVKPGGTFHIKTDHAGYFEWILREIEKARDIWNLLEKNADLHAAHPDPMRLEIPDVTLFEKLFIRDKIPIKSIILQRKKPDVELPLQSSRYAED